MLDLFSLIFLDDWFFLNESNHGLLNFRDVQTVQEARTPLQIWISQQTNGLVVEEARSDGNIFLFLSFTSSGKLMFCLETLTVCLA